MNKIAVLLTVHNRKSKTLSCLDSLFKAKLPAGYVFDVYLTDDGCTDGTPEAIRELFPYVNIIKGDGNLYWNRGMYTAWKEAAKCKYDFYLWLNDDIEFFTNFLELIIDTSQTYNNLEIIVGATKSKQTGEFTYGGRYIDGSAIEPNNKCHMVDMANGNCLLIPSYVFNKIGLMDSFYKHDKGDSDYSLMAKKNNIKIIQAFEYIGYCERHTKIPVWLDTNISLFQRLKYMHGVFGAQPKEVFYFENKHFGLIKAIKKIISNYCRCICPTLWILIGLEKGVYKIKIKKNDT